LRRKPTRLLAVLAGSGFEGCPRISRFITGAFRFRARLWLEAVYASIRWSKKPQPLELAFRGRIDGGTATVELACACRKEAWGGPHTPEGDPRRADLRGQAKAAWAGFLGVVSYDIREPEDVPGAVELFRMSRQARYRAPGSSRSLGFKGRRRGRQAGTARR
jgi:hypothetical protein